MSRSRRGTPIVGNTCAASDKWFKTSEHRRSRLAARLSLRYGEEPTGDRAFGDPWRSNKDGKQYLGQRADPRWLRK